MADRKCGYASKNFFTYSQRKGYYSLTPGYDMLSTALLMPEDTEELALTLNGKNAKSSVLILKLP